MNQEIEIEYKNLLTEEEYHLLSKEYFSEEVDSYTQKNTYFDTESEDLRKINCAFRIRIKAHEAEITLKSPFEGHHKELNSELTLDEAQELTSKQSIQVPEHIAEFLRSEFQLDISMIYKIAELKTERLEKDYRNCLIVLDKSWYSGLVDYELEVESPSIELGEALFHSILKEHSIPKRETLNKIARAYSAYKGNN